MSKDVTLQMARTAKPKLVQLLEELECDAAVGITSQAGSFALKVNLKQAGEGAKAPSEVDGVPVQYEVVGKIKKHDH